MTPLFLASLDQVAESATTIRLDDSDTVESKTTVT